MCARFSLFATADQIEKLLDIPVPDLPPRYNIAPTQMVLGAIEREGRRQLREFRWGLIPSWSKDEKVGNRLINARSETLLEKPAFRSALERRRCLIPANGFFEWRHDTHTEEVAAKGAAPSLFEDFDIPRSQVKTKTVKQPFFLSLKSGDAFAFAGLYEYWRKPSGEKVRSCTILTTRPNELIAPLHDRMPVIVRQADFDEWLDCEGPPAADLMEPFPASEMAATPVSTAVNDPNNESPEILLHN